MCRRSALFIRRFCFVRLYTASLHWQRNAVCVRGARRRKGGKRCERERCGLAAFLCDDISESKKRDETRKR